MFFYQITTSRCRAIFCSFFFSTSNIRLVEMKEKLSVLFFTSVQLDFVQTWRLTLLFGCHTPKISIPAPFKFYYCRHMVKKPKNAKIQIVHC